MSDDTVASLMAERDGLRADLNALHSTKETHRKKRAHWLAKYRAADSDVASLRGQVETLQAELATANEELQRVQVGSEYESGYTHGSLLAKQFRDERDRARDIAAHLEAELAKEEQP